MNTNKRLSKYKIIEKKFKFNFSQIDGKKK